MKRILFIAAVTVAATACNTERQSMVPASPSTPSTNESGQLRLSGKLNVSALSNLKKIGLVSKLNVSLQTLDGQLVEQIQALHPNTTYRMKLDGKGANRVEVRSCFGFDLLSKEEKPDKDQLSANYLIRTQSDVTEPLFVSFIPLRTVGTTMFREQPQNFWLAGKSSE